MKWRSLPAIRHSVDLLIFGNGSKVPRSQFQENQIFKIFKFLVVEILLSFDTMIVWRNSIH